MAKLRAAGQKLIWVDLDNTPHVPFCAPIIEDLKSRGYSITITARDAYQTCELADFFKLDYQRIGRHYGRHRILKIFGTCLRSTQLALVMRSQRPDLAIAHSSRAQTIASAILGVPCLQITDYEYAASAGLAKPTWIMVPKVIPVSKVKAERVLTYPGIKEDVYVPRFVPDPTLKAQLGLEETDVIVTLRPPANEAHYHKAGSDQLFDAVIKLLTATPGVKGVLLPRNSRQETTLRQELANLLESGKVIIPEVAVDGLNLIWHSDLVISGGGTMNREAAALGVPVYSIFRGEIGAVDRYLATRGRLVLLESVDDVRTRIVFTKRPKDSSKQQGNRTTLASIVDQIVSLVEHGTVILPETVNPPSEVAVKGARS